MGPWRPAWWTDTLRCPARRPQHHPPVLPSQDSQRTHHAANMPFKRWCRAGMYFVFLMKFLIDWYNATKYCIKWWSRSFSDQICRYMLNLHLNLLLSPGKNRISHTPSESFFTHRNFFLRIAWIWTVFELLNTWNYVSYFWIRYSDFQIDFHADLESFHAEVADGEWHTLHLIRDVAAKSLKLNLDDKTIVAVPSGVPFTGQSTDVFLGGEFETNNWGKAHRLQCFDLCSFRTFQYQTCF